MNSGKDTLSGTFVRTEDLTEEQEAAVESANESAPDPYVGPATSELQAGLHNA